MLCFREKQSVNPYAQGTDSGSLVTSFISSILTSVPLSCPIDFCVKLRQKLQGQRTGMHHAQLEMLWGKEDLWQRIKRMVAYLYEIQPEYELELPASEDTLDSMTVSLPAPSVLPSRQLKRKLIENFKRKSQQQHQLPKQKPAVPPKPKVPPKVAIINHNYFGSTVHHVNC